MERKRDDKEPLMPNNASPNDLETGGRFLHARNKVIGLWTNSCYLINKWLRDGNIATWGVALMMTLGLLLIISLALIDIKRKQIKMLTQSGEYSQEIVSPNNKEEADIVVESAFGKLLKLVTKQKGVPKPMSQIPFVTPTPTISITSTPLPTSSIIVTPIPTAEPTVDVLPGPITTPPPETIVDPRPIFSFVNLQNYALNGCEKEIRQPFMTSYSEGSEPIRSVSLSGNNLRVFFKNSSNIQNGNALFPCERFDMSYKLNQIHKVKHTQTYRFTKPFANQDPDVIAMEHSIKFWNAGIAHECGVQTRFSKLPYINYRFSFYSNKQVGWTEISHPDLTAMVKLWEDGQYHTISTVCSSTGSDFKLETVTIDGREFYLGNLNMTSNAQITTNPRSYVSVYAVQIDGRNDDRDVEVEFSNIGVWIY